MHVSECYMMDLEYLIQRCMHAICWKKTLTLGSGLFCQMKILFSDTLVSI